MSLSSFLGPVLDVRTGYLRMADEFNKGRWGDNFLWLADLQENLREPLYVDAVHYSGHMSRIIAEIISVKLGL